MAKTKTKGTAKTVSDTPVPQPITISSTNPKIMADNIKKLEKAIKGADDASEISYDNTESHLTASNVQAAIDEIVSGLTAPAASDVTYDNTSSGLTADDTQEAIDELAGSMKQTYSNLNITNSVGGAETNKATLYASGNIGLIVFAWSCQNNESEQLTVALPTGWGTAIGTGIVARDNTNGNLISVYMSNNELNTYNHVGTMTVGNTYTVCCPVIKS